MMWQSYHERMGSGMTRTANIKQIKSSFARRVDALPEVNVQIHCQHNTKEKRFRAHENILHTKRCLLFSIALRHYWQPKCHNSLRNRFKKKLESMSALIRASTASDLNWIEMKWLELDKWRTWERALTPTQKREKRNRFVYIKMMR